MGNSFTAKAPSSVLNSGSEFPDTPNASEMMDLTVTRERCLSPSLIDSFFRVLRHGSDDVIKQKLNNTKTNSIDSRTSQCKDFIHRELYPSWLVRNRIINFCDREAFELKREIEAKYSTSNADLIPEIDPRIDPYAAREREEQREAHYNDWKRLRNWVQNQREVEKILQIRSNNVLGEVCGHSTDYIEQFKKFSKSI